MNAPAANNFDALHKKLSEQQEVARQQWLTTQYNIRQDLLAVVVLLWQHYFPNHDLAEMHVSKAPDARLVIRTTKNDSEAPLMSVSLCSRLHFTISLYADGLLRYASHVNLQTGPDYSEQSTSQQLVVLAQFFAQLHKKLATAPEQINIHALAEKTLREAQGTTPLFPRNTQDFLAAQKLVESLAKNTVSAKARHNLQAAQKLMQQKVAKP